MNVYNTDTPENTAGLIKPAASSISEQLFNDSVSFVMDSLVQNVSFLAPALHEILFVPVYPLNKPRIEGNSIQIDPDAFVNTLLVDPLKCESIILHCLGHILLGHTSFNPGSENESGRIACDVLTMRFVQSIKPDVLTPAQRSVLNELTGYYGADLSHPMLYRAMLEDQTPFDQLGSLLRLIECDDHSVWTASIAPEIKLPAFQNSGVNSRSDARRGSSSASQSRRLNIQLSNRQTASLAKALAKYTDLKETARIDIDSINIPMYLQCQTDSGVLMVEENEFTEERKLSSFVVAIDTSGSCARDLTQRFLEITRDILLRDHLFFRRFNLHIIQCDDHIRRDDHIISESDFGRYIRCLEIYGGGGTDFRPIFERVDQLIKRRKLPGLKGILILSDGLGLYPEHKPNYGVTFAFPEQRYDSIDTPEWVDKVVFPLRSETFENEVT